MIQRPPISTLFPYTALFRSFALFYTLDRCLKCEFPKNLVKRLTVFQGKQTIPQPIHWCYSHAGPKIGNEPMETVVIAIMLFMSSAGELDGSWLAKHKLSLNR